MRVSAGTGTRAEALPRKLGRRLVIGVLVLVFVTVGIVYAGTLVEAHVGFPGCTRSLGDSASQNGHATTALLPPKVRCSYPTDDLLGASAAHDDHFAIFWIVILGFLAVLVVPSLLLAADWGEGRIASDR